MLRREGSVGTIGNGVEDTMKLPLGRTESIGHPTWNERSESLAERLCGGRKRDC